MNLSKNVDIKFSVKRKPPKASDPMTEQKLYLDARVEHDRELMVCKFSKRKDRVFTGCSDGNLRSIDAVTLQVLNVFESEDKLAPITGIALSPFTDYYIGAHVNGTIKYWETKEQHRCMLTVQQDSQILGLSASHVAPHLATCCEDSKIVLYDIITGQRSRDFSGSFKNEISDGHKSRVFSVAFSPTSEHELVSGGWDRTVQVWDVRKKTSVRYFSGPYICGEGLDFSPDGRKLLACSYKRDNNVLIWDFRAGKILSDLTKDTSKVYSGHFINSTFIVTTSADPSTVRILNVDTEESAAIYRTNLPGMYTADGEVCLIGQEKTVPINLIVTAGKSLLKLKTICHVAD